VPHPGHRHPSKPVRKRRERILAAAELDLFISKFEGLNSKFRLVCRGYDQHSAARLIAMNSLCSGVITIALRPYRADDAVNSPDSPTEA
jgi:hypothetical protein